MLSANSPLVECSTVGAPPLPPEVPITLTTEVKPLLILGRKGLSCEVTRGQQPHWQEERHLDLRNNWWPCMPWIEGAKAEVLSPVGLPQLEDQKGEGVLQHLCALVPHPDLQGLHAHYVVFMPVVWGPQGSSFLWWAVVGWEVSHMWRTALMGSPVRRSELGRCHLSWRKVLSSPGW